MILTDRRRVELSGDSTARCMVCRTHGPAFDPRADLDAVAIMRYGTPITQALRTFVAHGTIDAHRFS